MNNYEKLVFSTFLFTEAAIQYLWYRYLESFNGSLMMVVTNVLVPSLRVEIHSEI